MDSESLMYLVHAGVEVDRLDLLPEDRALVYSWLWAAFFRLAYPSLPLVPHSKPSICHMLAEHPYTLDGGERRWSALYWRNQIKDAEELIEGRPNLKSATQNLRNRISTFHQLARREELLNQCFKGKQRKQRQAKANRDDRRYYESKGKRIFEQDLEAVQKLVGDERTKEVLRYLYLRDED